MKPVVKLGLVAAGGIAAYLPIHNYRFNQMVKSTLVLMWGSGDYTGDGMRTLADWHHFQRCLWGPKIHPAGYECWQDTTCGVFDVEKECDVDMVDYVKWLEGFEE